MKFGEEHDVTGYRVKKCFTYDPTQGAFSGQISSYGSIVFRAVEAYLNYMEASYMKLGRIDDIAERYWKAIRSRAGVDDDYEKTIRLTDMSEEKKVIGELIQVDSLLILLCLIFAEKEGVSW